MSFLDKYKRRDYDDYAPRRDRDYLDRDRLSREEPRRYDVAYSTSKFEDATRDASVKSQMFELESKLAAREARVAELERELRSAADIEAQQAKAMKTMHHRLEELEHDAEGLAAARGKGDLTIATLQADNRQLQERLLELEDRLRKALDNRESRAEESREAAANYEELRQALGIGLWPEAGTIRSHEALMRKVRDHVEDFNDYKNRNRKLEENLEGAEDEVRRNRETVRQLLHDIERAKKFTATTEVLKEERDVAVRQEEGYRGELSRMEDRLLEARRQWEEAQWELRQQAAKLGEVDAAARKAEAAEAAAATEARAFRDTLAALLSDTRIPITATEDGIKEKIRQLVASRSEVAAATRQLEEKLGEVSSQLEDQAELHKRAVQRARKAEGELDELRERLDAAQGELAATDILQTGLKSDKQKYLDFLGELARVMRMGEVAEGEVSGDALLARAEQLAKAESENYAKSRSARTLGPERRAKDLERELEMKSNHLDRMRRKLQSVEKELTNRAEHDYDELLSASRRGDRSYEKLQRQLHEARTTVASMKKEIVENQALKITVEELKRQLAEANRQCDEYEGLRSKQSRKLAALKAGKDQAEQEATHGYKVTEATIQSLSNQLQRLKGQLEEVKRREKQVGPIKNLLIDDLLVWFYHSWTTF